MIKQVIKFGAATGAGLVLMGGVAFASPSITNTGSHSTNKITSKNINKCKVINKNTVVVANSNTQTAKSGKAKVTWNTTGGDATSGGATNSNDTTLDLGVTNGPTDSCSCGCSEVLTLDGSIDTTGRHSWNVISSLNVNVQKFVNVNNVTVANSSTQTATSGDASVSGNTTGGSAISGDTSNTNTTGLTVEVSNN